MELYSYDGPVVEFEKCIQSHWKSQTYASSEKKARSNLAYQFKRETGRSNNSKIIIPGKLTIEGGYEH